MAFCSTSLTARCRAALPDSTLPTYPFNATLNSPSNPFGSELLSSFVVADAHGEDLRSQPVARILRSTLQIWHSESHSLSGCYAFQFNVQLDSSPEGLP